LKPAIARRRERQYPDEGTHSARDDFERDRDRVIFSLAFHRLAGVSQIVRTGEENIFHTRQQHTIKVAHVGRRLAEYLLSKSQDHQNLRSLALNPDVVEAACLIHDLGHAPFGHVGEEALDECVTRTDEEGFNANAQSLRIVTKLAVRKSLQDGMNLTRATLAATLKYPWVRPLESEKTLFSPKDWNDRRKKWGAYRSEEAALKFALAEMSEHRVAGMPENRVAGMPQHRVVLEAEIMDWADDIAYSLHDIEEFHRCGAVPWEDIFSKSGEEKLSRPSKNRDGEPLDMNAAYKEVRKFVREAFSESLYQRYDGRPTQRLEMRTLLTALTQRFIDSADIDPRNSGPRLLVADKTYAQVRVLKRITEHFVREAPPIAAQRFGYKRVVQDLYEHFLTADKERDFPLFTPRRFHHVWRFSMSRARFAADCVGALTDLEALKFHARLNGYDGGSVMDPIVR
jgi:dGTPase